VHGKLFAIFLASVIVKVLFANFLQAGQTSLSFA